MNKVLLAGFAIAALALGVVPAAAADMDNRPVYKAPTITPSYYDWSGFYVGGHVGGAWADKTWTQTFPGAFAGNASTFSADGFIGGGQIGYNWQMQNWVWGLEADIQGTDEKGSRLFTCPTGVCSAPFGVIAVFPGPAVPATLSQKIDWFGTVRGRAGVLVTPTVLLYGTGGLAYGEVKTSDAIGLVPALFSTTSTNVGWTVGAGIEGAIGGNWTAKLEYLYIDLGRASGSFLTTSAAFGGGVITSNFSSRITDNVLRVGVNYRFGGPVVARY